MVKTDLVYSPNLRGVDLGKFKSIPQVLEELGISRAALYKYLAEGKIHAKKDELGERTIFKFEPEEVIRFKDTMKKKREPGKSLTQG